MQGLFDWLLDLLGTALGHGIKRLYHVIEKALGAWGNVATAAFGESKLQGLFCLFPLYAVHYASKLEKQRSEIRSVIWDLAVAAAAKNLEAAGAHCSSNSPAEEAMAGVIESNYEVFSGCKLLTITRQTPRSSGGLSTCHIEGAFINGDNQGWPFEAWLAKDDYVWKVTDIRVGLAAKVAAEAWSKKKTFVATGLAAIGVILLVLGIVMPSRNLEFLGWLAILVLIWLVFRYSRRKK